MPENSERRPPRRARGKTKRWTDADLDKLAEVTPDDIDAAQDAWVRHGHRDAYGRLLDAEPEEET